jgi:hypothetical protein
VRIASLIPIIVAAALLPFACGGEELGDDERAVRSTLHGYVSALAHNDFDRACSLLTNEEIASMRDSGRRQVGKPSCAAALKVFFGAYTPRDAKRFRIRSVKISGDRAVAATDNKVGTKSFLSKVRGTWLIDSETVNSYDAESAANKWAAQRQRAGETFKPVHCSASETSGKSRKGREAQDTLWAEFGCPVRFRPSGRRYVVYLRAVNDYEDVRVVGSLPWSEAIQIVPIPQRLK